MQGTGPIEILHSLQQQMSKHLFTFLRTLPNLTFNNFIIVVIFIVGHFVHGFSLKTMSPSSDMQAFREVVRKSKHVVVLTGAGISAESGVPTFRGAGGFWRKYQAQSLASPTAFAKNPGLVWEFYHYRREVVLTKQPNPVKGRIEFLN